MNHLDFPENQARCGYFRQVGLENNALKTPS
jgi:hypothetical protein